MGKKYLIIANTERMYDIIRNKYQLVSKTTRMINENTDKTKLYNMLIGECGTYYEVTSKEGVKLIPDIWIWCNQDMIRMNHNTLCSKYLKKWNNYRFSHMKYKFSSIIKTYVNNDKLIFMLEFEDMVLLAEKLIDNHKFEVSNAIKAVEYIYQKGMNNERYEIKNVSENLEDFIKELKEYSSIRRRKASVYN